MFVLSFHVSTFSSKWSPEKEDELSRLETRLLLFLPKRLILCRGFILWIFLCCRKCIRKTRVEATRGAGTTECRRGVNGQMPSGRRREKGEALPGAPVEWFTVRQKKEEARDGARRSSN